MGTLDQLTQQLLLQTLQFVPRLIVALITFGAAWLLATPAGRAVHEMLSKRMDPQGLPQLLARLTRWTVRIGGSLIALEQVHFNITGFIAGLGITGLTIGFALQDITRNFVAGVLLLFRKPFAVNDTVNAGGFTGQILEINTRDTAIKTAGGELVIVPNITIFENPITNFSRSRERQRTVTLKLSAGQDVELALRALRDALQHVPGVLQAPPPTVWAEQPGYAMITLTARFWVDTETHDLLEVHSAAVIALHNTITALAEQSPA